MEDNGSSKTTFLSTRDLSFERRLMVEKLAHQAVSPRAAMAEHRTMLVR